MENELDLRVGDVVLVEGIVLRVQGSEIVIRDLDGLTTSAAFRRRSVKSIISRAETDAEKIARLEAELATAPRWIEWDGKGAACPISSHIKLVVRYKSGDQSLGYASDFWWFSKGQNCVAAYMVLPQ